jgi:CheY-like chemotaxis protein
MTNLRDGVDTATTWMPRAGHRTCAAAAAYDASEMAAVQVLVADDQEGHRKLLDLLLSIEGYDLTLVEDGREALEHLQKHTPALAILDVAMPFLTGLEVADRMRHVGRLKDTKIIVLTASRDERTRERAREIPVDALVLKPLEGKDFRALVKAVLAGEKQSI